MRTEHLKVSIQKRLTNSQFDREENKLGRGRRQIDIQNHISLVFLQKQTGCVVAKYMSDNDNRLGSEMLSINLVVPA